MQVRLSAFNLAYWQEYGDWLDGRSRKALKTGTTVCLTNNSGVLGTVVALGATGPYYDHSVDPKKIVKEVEVSWHNGPRKGKVETKKTAELVNYTAYKCAIMKHLEKMNAAEVKAGLVAPK